MDAIDVAILMDQGREEKDPAYLRLIYAVLRQQLSYDRFADYADAIGLQD